MQSAAVLDALIDGTVFVISRATSFNQVLLSDSTVVILVLVPEDKQLDSPSSIAKL
jgi:hypothetical protein